jgi:hypothetical protein
LFDLPFFHLDLSMEPSLEDELRLANLSVHYAEDEYYADKYKWNIALVGPEILLKILYQANTPCSYCTDRTSPDQMILSTTLPNTRSPGTTLL